MLLRLICPLLLLSTVLCSLVDIKRLQSSRPQEAPKSFDCAMRAYAWEYAQKLQAFRGDSLRLVYDALELSTYCGSKYDLRISQEVLKKNKTVPGIPQQQRNQDAPTFFVDFDSGSDSNPGTMQSPFKTLSFAILHSRIVVGPKTIYLRAGVHYLSETIKLTVIDSQLTISSYNNEDVEISGGIPLMTKWVPYKISKQPVLEEYVNVNNIYGRVVTPGENTTTLRYLGKYESAAQCQQACASYQIGKVKCYAYTYHHPNKAGYAKICYGDITQIWGPNPDPDVTSGRWVQYNIYKADLSTQNVGNLTGLQIQKGGKRVTRARYPSADTETAFFPDGWIAETSKWAPPQAYPPATTILVDNPARTDIAFFQKYTVGTGGPCSIFTPAESYWCSKYNDGGGPGLFETPQGLTYFPNTFLNATFSEKGKNAVVHAWHSYHWAMWMYQVDSIDDTTNQISWKYGGFQGARGSILTHGGSEWFLENVLELLDTPNEYYYDAPTKTLYYFHNDTVAPPDDLKLVATNLKNMIEVNSPQDAPLVGLTISGIRFTGAAYTYLDPHGVPSGGDWALQRMGALFFEGTENVVIQDCTFIRLEGINIMLSGYNRGTVIQRNEFAWTGESAIAAWGYTKGIDGTDGNQPRGAQVLYNIFREIGMYQKQSSAWFQGKSCQHTIKGNIMFNGPRALININDGFGGATEITQNLLFNANRETSDQGPFNSWDRQPFLTEVADGTTPSLTPAYNSIHHNFFICNFGSNMCVDNDDGSSYYLIHHNFEVYGGHKSDFGGHNKFTYDSINAYSKVYDDGRCCDIETQPPNFVPYYVDGYYNNTCIQVPTVPYIRHAGCDPTKPDLTTLSISHHNRVYNKEGKATVGCGSKVIDEAVWQQAGFDVGTQAFPLPTDQEVIGWAKLLLGN